MTKQLVLAALSAVAVLSTSSAFADADEELFRPRPGGRWRCERAERILREAEHHHQLAAIQLSRVNEICGGAPACIIAAQNHYNQTYSSLVAAQQNYNRACY